MKILAVDDSKLIASFVKQSLPSPHFTVHSVENGMLALEKLRSGERFDIILLDWNMPVMDGPTFLEKAGNEKLLRCPVIMMTTENHPEKIMRALSLGAKEYMMKPFTDVILNEKIQMVLKKVG